MPSHFRASLFPQNHSEKTIALHLRGAGRPFKRAASAVAMLLFVLAIIIAIFTLSALCFGAFWGGF